MDELLEIDRLCAELDALRASRLRLVLAADADRCRIERDLHGGLQQDLVALAVKVQLAAASVDAGPEVVRSKLDEIGRELQRALDAAAELAFRTYPPLLDAGGLAPAVRAAAEREGARVTVDVPAQVTYRPEVAASIYWCCVEAFEGLAAGSEVAVTVWVEGGAVILDLVASGGFDRGLERSRDRVVALGGRIEVVAEAGEVRVRAELPLEL